MPSAEGRCCRIIHPSRESNYFILELSEGFRVFNTKEKRISGTQVVRNDLAVKNKRFSQLNQCFFPKKHWIPDVFTSGIGGGRWIRFSAEKPRRLRQSTGLSPRAAFRIHLPECPSAERRAIRKDVSSFWWGKVDSKTIRNVAYGIYCGIKSISSRWTTRYSLCHPYNL